MGLFKGPHFFLNVGTLERRPPGGAAVLIQKTIQFLRDDLQTSWGFCLLQPKYQGRSVILDEAPIPPDPRAMVFCTVVLP